MDLDDGERYAAAALFTLALHTTQVEAGVDEVGNRLDAYKSAWGCPDEEFFDDLICVPEDEPWPGMEVPKGFWGFDCCAPQGLCRRVYSALGIAESRWPGLLKMPGVSEAANAHDAQVALVALVRRYGALLDPAVGPLITRPGAAVEWASTAEGGEAAAAAPLLPEAAAVPLLSPLPAQAQDEQQQQQLLELEEEQLEDEGQQQLEGGQGEMPDLLGDEVVDTARASDQPPHQQLPPLLLKPLQQEEVPVLGFESQQQHGQGQEQGRGEASGADVAAAGVATAEAGASKRRHDEEAARDVAMEAATSAGAAGPSSAGAGTAGGSGAAAAAVVATVTAPACSGAPQDKDRSSGQQQPGDGAWMMAASLNGSSPQLEQLNRRRSGNGCRVEAGGDGEGGGAGRGAAGGTASADASADASGHDSGREDAGAVGGAVDLLAVQPGGAGEADGESAALPSSCCSRQPAHPHTHTHDPTHQSILALYELIGACLRAASGAGDGEVDGEGGGECAGKDVGEGPSAAGGSAGEAGSSSSASGNMGASSGGGGGGFFSRIRRGGGGRKRGVASAGGGGGGGVRPAGAERVAIVRVVRKPLVRWYDARARVALRRFCHWLHIPGPKMHAMEQMWALQLLRLRTDGGEFDFGDSARAAGGGAGARYWTYLKISAGALGGAALLALTGGLAAPAIAAGLGSAIMVLHGGVAAATAVTTLGASTAGTAAISGTFGVIGASHAATKTADLYGDLQEFGFLSISSPVLLPHAPSACTPPEQPQEQQQLPQQLLEGREDLQGQGCKQGGQGHGKGDGCKQGADPHHRHHHQQQQQHHHHQRNSQDCHHRHQTHHHPQHRHQAHQQDSAAAAAAGHNETHHPKEPQQQPQQEQPCSDSREPPADAGAAFSSAEAAAAPSTPTRTAGTPRKSFQLHRYLSGGGAANSGGDGEDEASQRTDANASRSVDGDGGEDDPWAYDEDDDPWAAEAAAGAAGAAPSAVLRARLASAGGVGADVDVAFVEALLAELDAEEADLDGGGGDGSGGADGGGGGEGGAGAEGARGVGLASGNGGSERVEPAGGCVGSVASTGSSSSSSSKVWSWFRSGSRSSSSKASTSAAAAAAATAPNKSAVAAKDSKAAAAAAKAAGVAGYAGKGKDKGRGNGQDKDKDKGQGQQDPPLLRVPVNPRRSGDATLALTIAVNGWVKCTDDFVAPWRPLPSAGRELWGLAWESDVLRSLGGALRKFIRDKAIEESSKMVVRLGVSTALVTAMMPAMAVMSAINITIGSRWRVALRRAQLAGRCLAHMLMQGAHGDRPVTLIGFSMGARLIFHCLLELSRCGARGLVEAAVLLGAPVSANEVRWTQARAAVSGRLVNAFSGNDWVLGVIFRAHSRSSLVGRAAGCAPVAVAGVENTNLSALIAGHTQYLEKLEEVLSALNLAES